MSPVISNLIVGSDDVIKPYQFVNPQPFAAWARMTMTGPSVYGSLAFAGGEMLIMPSVGRTGRTFRTCLGAGAGRTVVSGWNDKAKGFSVSARVLAGGNFHRKGVRS